MGEERQKVIVEAAELWSHRWGDADLRDGPTFAEHLDAALTAWEDERLLAMGATLSRPCDKCQGSGVLLGIGMPDRTCPTCVDGMLPSLLVPRAALEQVGWRWPNGSLSIDTRYRPATNCLPVYRLTEEAE